MGDHFYYYWLPLHMSKEKKSKENGGLPATCNHYNSDYEHRHPCPPTTSSTDPSVLTSFLQQLQWCPISAEYSLDADVVAIL